MPGRPTARVSTPATPLDILENHVSGTFPTGAPSVRFRLAICLAGASFATRPEQSAAAIASAAARRDQLSRFLLLGCRRIGTESRLLERGANRGGGCTLGNCRRVTAGDVSFDGDPRCVWRVVSCVFTR
jgi:hypothetical protein